MAQQQQDQNPVPLTDLLAKSKAWLNSGPLSPEERAAVQEAAKGKLRRLRWVYLEATEVIAARLGLVLERLGQVDIRAEAKRGLMHERRRLEDLMAEAVARDEAQAERPEGCWCFGFGGKDEAILALPPEGVERYSVWENQSGNVRGNQPGAIAREERVWGTCCPYCPEGRAEAEHKRAVGEALRTGRPVMTLTDWRLSGVPDGMLSWRLETSPVCEQDIDLMVRLMAVTERESWYFYGQHGTGKTGLAVGLAWAWREQYRRPVLFTALPDLLSEIRATYGRPGEGQTELEIIRRFGDSPFLVLDDLGAEQVSGTGWVEDRMFQIVGRRHSNGLPTVFTSNLSVDETGARLGARLAWRIWEMCGGQERVKEVTGPNLRLTLG